jgi:hypothetical protein
MIILPNMKKLPWICCSLVLFATPLLADDKAKDTPGEDPVIEVIVDGQAKPAGAVSSREDYGTEVFVDDEERSTYFKGTGPKDGKLKSIEVREGKAWRFRRVMDYNEDGKMAWEMEEDGFTIIYVRDGNGKIVEQRGLPSRDPKTLQVLKEKEEKLLKAIADAPEAKKSQAWHDLGLFYAGQMKDSAKALTLVPHLTVRQHLFNVKGCAVNWDRRRTYAQKIEGYQKLIPEFPEQREFLESTIKATQENIDQGKDP